MKALHAALVAVFLSMWRGPQDSPAHFDCDYEWHIGKGWACAVYCDEGCAGTTVSIPCGSCATTNVCICDIIGPNQFCCEMHESTCTPGVFCPGGDCGSSGCSGHDPCVRAADYDESFHPPKLIWVGAICN